MKKIILLFLITQLAFCQTDYEKCHIQIKFTKGIKHFGDTMRDALIYLPLNEYQISYKVNMIITNEGKIENVTVEPLNSLLHHAFSDALQNYKFINPAKDENNNKIASFFSFSLTF